MSVLDTVTCRQIDADVVLDLGCFPHGKVFSTRLLVQRFSPRELYAYDPWPKTIEGTVMIGSTVVTTRRAAAWTHAGMMRYTHADAGATIVRENERGQWAQHTHSDVETIDLGELLEHLGFAIVKMDIEGAEYALLADLHRRGLDERIALLLIEWHDEHMPEVYSRWRETLESVLRCPIEEWTL